ncbi:hypothetical protein BDN71DRAFT_1428203 [Pleurotus eryngii]|uniref:Aspartate/glutamate/uridylate kinase domain-containing protein n=1 Tax=Pleurotus eryngii TaxID=5323 RepID=A0A9P6DIC5_PLEER|nr:hypothetical protein BDN71DRAFT_1428203 [Pleurotus eryngii]
MRVAARVLSAALPRQHRQPGRALGLQDHDGSSQPRRRRGIRVFDDIILDDDTEGGASPGVLDQRSTTDYPLLYARFPVVTGFFGQAPGSLLQQVTLGHTDPCSALLAVGLEAGELQIWKEVDGIFTADPHKRQRRRYITGVRSCARSRWSMGKKIPICIRNVEKPEGGGTIIHPDSDVDAADALDTASATLAGTRSPLPSRVTIEELIIVLHGNSNRKSASHGFLAGIFSTLNRFGVVVDLIRTSEVCVSMAIERARARKVPGRPVNDRRENGCGTARREMGIRSLVGARMRGMVGIAIRGGGRSAPSHSMMGNVNVEMISQGASETRIPSCRMNAIGAYHVTGRGLSVAAPTSPLDSPTSQCAPPQRWTSTSPFSETQRPTFSSQSRSTLHTRAGRYTLWRGAAEGCVTKDYKCGFREQGHGL